MRRAFVSLSALAIVLLFLVPAHAVSSTLVINEIDYDQPGTDGAEFLELKNVSAGPVALGGHSVVLVNGTGGGATTYQTIALPAVDLAAGGYFVVCGNAATTLNCDLDVAPDTNLIQNGAPRRGRPAVGEHADRRRELRGQQRRAVHGRVGRRPRGRRGQRRPGDLRLPDGTDTDQNAADLDLVCITPGTENTTATVDCRPSVVARIHEIQGAAHVSPLDDRAVADVPGIVTAVRNNGFWFQDPDVDADLETSEGIFCTSSVPSVAVGDSVRVDGVVDEFTPGGAATANLSITELTGPTVELLSTGNPVPAAIVIGDGGRLPRRR